MLSLRCLVPGEGRARAPERRPALTSGLLLVWAGDPVAEEGRTSLGVVVEGEVAPSYQQEGREAGVPSSRPALSVEEKAFAVDPWAWSSWLC